MARRLGFFGAVVVALSAYNLIIGMGTLDHYSGRPDDAPHLHAPDLVRGTAWVVLAAASAALVVWAGRGRYAVRCQRVALMLLQVMPMVRGTSHLYAWVMSWPGWGLTPGPRRWWEEGSPAGWYTAAPWLGEVVLIWVVSSAIGKYGLRTGGTDAGIAYRRVAP